jgi:hypothetical protein
MAAFLDRHDARYLIQNYKLFIKTLEELMNNPEPNLKLQAVIAYNRLILKSSNPDILIESIPPMLEEFESAE